MKKRESDRERGRREKKKRKESRAKEKEREIGKIRERDRNRKEGREEVQMISQDGANTRAHTCTHARARANSPPEKLCVLKLSYCPLTYLAFCCNGIAPSILSQEREYQ